MGAISCRSMWTKTSCFMMALGLGAVTVACSETPDENDGSDTDNPGETDTAMPPGDMEDPDDPGNPPGTDPNGGGPVVPPTEIDGTETPVSATYWPKGVDLGLADPDANMRAVIVFQLRNQSELTALIASLYD